MNYFIVFDFETDGVDAETCNPVQVACMTIDPYTLELVPGSEFCSDMKPNGIDDLDTFLADEKRMRTIGFHATNGKCSIDNVVKRWQESPSPETVWKNFSQHVNKYNPKKTQKGAPIACGANIVKFDLIIAKRLNEQYKIGRMFSYDTRTVDLTPLFFHTLLWDNEVSSYSMDNMRKYFGQKNTNSHDALQDVKDEAEFVIRYLKFFKNVFEKGNNPYKGCMK